MTKKEFKYLINIIALFAIVLAYFGMKLVSSPGLSTSSQPVQAGAVKIRYAIDGDTIKLSDGENVRLIGIDTPESRYNDKTMRDSRRSKKDINTILGMGKLASKFTRGLVEGKSVRLEFDVEKRDRYGRLLAYVYLEDGTFVNARIVEEGYAQAMTIPPNVKYADLFLRLQNEAREKRKGLWRDADTLRLF
jgi:micrococcal nuclease